MFLKASEIAFELYDFALYSPHRYKSVICKRIKEGNGLSFIKSLVKYERVLKAIKNSFDVRDIEYILLKNIKG